MKPSKPTKETLQRQSSPQRPQQQNSGGGFLSFMINLGGAVAAVVIIMALFNNVEGYDWLLNTMLKGNLETIEKYPNLTTQQRYEAKWGGEVNYLFQIKNSTPDSAKILLPPRKTMVEVGLKSFNDIPHVVYFLYPRKVIFADDSKAVASNANYLVSVNGWGLERLKEPITNPQPFMILPIK
jgi:hypothetical protein